MVFLVVILLLRLSIVIVQIVLTKNSGNGFEFIVDKGIALLYTTPLHVTDVNLTQVCKKIQNHSHKLKFSLDCRQGGGLVLLAVFGPKPSSLLQAFR